MDRGWQDYTDCWISHSFVREAIALLSTQSNWGNEISRRTPINAIVYYGDDDEDKNMPVTFSPGCPM